jgi:hypothetical protein
MPDPFRILIVGGGSAGWMTAAYLSKALDRGVNISLIESPNIKTIGVGEATFSTIRLFFDFLGLEEEVWMPACNATYKLAIKFVDWNAERRHFYHPFQRYEAVRGHSLAEWWLKLRRHDEPFDYACFTVPLLCDAKRSPKFMDGMVFDDKVAAYLSSKNPTQAMVLENLRIQYPYAYHFDANLIAKFMAGYAQNRGVLHIEDRVVSVNVLDNGLLESVETQGHGALGADFFVDCTGFQGLLINRTLGEPFISFSESLLCDSAVAMQVPSDDRRDGINPYTTATALSAGWVWDIPLFGRKGTGYVYSGSHLSKGEAEEELRRHLGARSNGCSASHIKMRIGRNRNSWSKNCVAIGLSSGFVEPLESTGIFFIQHGIEQLVNHFPTVALNEANIKSYNKAVADCMDGIRDFLSLHYYASTRSDSEFWKATKRDIVLSDSLAERVSFWKTRLPTPRSIPSSYHGFEAYSYSVMLLGLGCRPPAILPSLSYMDDSEARIAFEVIRDRSHRLGTTLPSQYEYLSSLRGYSGSQRSSQAALAGNARSA